MGKASNFNSVREKNLYFFLVGGTQKLQKTDFFRKTLTPRNLLKENFFQHRTMSKLTSRRIWKCIIYEGYGDFCASYYPSKSAHGGKSESVPIIMRCQKKRHGHNNEFWALPLNQRGTNPIGPTLIQWRRSELKIVAVSFFFNADFGCQQNWKFEWTLEADNYGLKPLNLKNYNIFGILRTSPFSWYHPI